MGKVVPSYRMTLETKIQRWSGFAKALRSDQKEVSEELKDLRWSFASESSNATNPIIFEPMVMSIVLSQRKKISRIKEQLCEIFWRANKRKS